MKLLKLINKIYNATLNKKGVNAFILNKYNIEFLVNKFSQDKYVDVSQTAPTAISYLLTGYFINTSPAFFKNNLLPEIDKAMSGQPFEKDGGGEMSFLEIDAENSVFTNLSNDGLYEFIPTRDLKEISVSWLNWISDNKLEKYINS